MVAGFDDSVTRLPSLYCEAIARNFFALFVESVDIDINYSIIKQFPMVLTEFELINISSVMHMKIFSKVVTHNSVNIKNLIPTSMPVPR
jgi:hypothetical protein